MFFRFIVYMILAYTALRIVRWLITPSRLAARRFSASGTRSSQMIRCTRCGMFVTQKSALMLGGREFCSKSCADQRVHST